MSEKVKAESFRKGALVQPATTPWFWGEQGHDENGNKLTGKIKGEGIFSGWVVVEWPNGITRTYRAGGSAHHDIFDLIYVNENKEVFVSDVSEKDALEKEVKKYLVDTVENEDYPYICVNKLEEIDLYNKDPKSVKTYSWSYIVNIQEE